VDWLDGTMESFVVTWIQLLIQTLCIDTIMSGKSLLVL